MKRPRCPHCNEEQNSLLNTVTIHKLKRQKGTATCPYCEKDYSWKSPVNAIGVTTEPKKSFKIF